MPYVYKYNWNLFILLFILYHIKLYYSHIIVKRIVLYCMVIDRSVHLFFAAIRLCVESCWKKKRERSFVLSRGGKENRRGRTTRQNPPLKKKKEGSGTGRDRENVRRHARSCKRGVKWISRSQRWQRPRGSATSKEDLTFLEMDETCGLSPWSDPFRRVKKNVRQAWKPKTMSRRLKVTSQRLTSQKATFIKTFIFGRKESKECLYFKRKKNMSLSLTCQLSRSTCFPNK